MLIIKVTNLEAFIMTFIPQSDKKAVDVSIMFEHEKRDVD
jgi:hypothetical protein